MIFCNGMYLQKCYSVLVYLLYMQSPANMVVPKIASAIQSVDSYNALYKTPTKLAKIKI
jgi:hypothetical protein